MVSVKSLRDVFAHPLVEVVMAYLVLLSLMIVIVDFIVEVPADVRLQMYTLDLIVVAVLFLDLVVRAFRSGRPLSYLVFHFYEVIALVPLYAIYLVEASSVFGLVRALRFIRLARFIVISARSGALFRAFLETSKSLQASTVIGALLLTVLVSAVTVYFAESGASGSIKSFWDALWWAFATVTTVGYGDVVPQSGLGKAVGVLTMIVGIGVYSALIGIIAASLTNIAKKAERAEDLASRLERLEELSEEELEELLKNIRKMWSKGFGFHSGFDINRLTLGFKGLRAPFIGAHILDLHPFRVTPTHSSPWGSPLWGNPHILLCGAHSGLHYIPTSWASNFRSRRQTL